MGLKLKAGCTKENIFDKENPLTGCYGVIDEMSVDKAACVASFKFRIYSRVCTKEERNKDIVTPIEVMSFTVVNNGEKTDFDDFFSVGAVQSDGDQFALAYNYLKQLLSKPDRQDPDVLPTLVFKDWEDLL